MKNKKITSIALAILTGSVSQIAFAAKDSKDMNHDKDTTMSSTKEVTRIAEDRVDELTTASDLIGSSVYDKNGDKIGDIKDVSFGRNVMASMSNDRHSWNSDSNSMNKSDSQTSSHMDRDSTGHMDTQSRQASSSESYASQEKSRGDKDKQSDSSSWDSDNSDRRDEMATASKQASIPESYANQDRNSDSSSWNSTDSSDSSSGDVEMNNRQASRSESYASQNQNSSSQNRENRNSQNWENRNSDTVSNESSQMMSNRPEAVVFISVGGVFGIGDDLVQVPAKQITYDSSEERFVLQGHSVDEVTSIAQKGQSNFDENDYYADNWYEYNMYGTYGYPYGSETVRGMRDFGSDEETIRDAFQNDSTLSSASTSIQINEKNDEIVLKGTVRSESLKQRAEELAKRETTLDVTNNIKVKSD
ncbi:BON domain-containing protein [Pelagicoccus sp. SDUM812002]|uniref:BON domain-containing protein n=1 Tax=Pelagicoccus sp. SDUM812002 TaxID=3041266 RepID=UPI0028107954|nr:BON domain-containing protein [Pelagicoccus sp. SDUM812002]MDQ8185832.1 BON domain-containing protein [Pelagicoccus sp. SDUM812002]